MPFLATYQKRKKKILNVTYRKKKKPLFKISLEPLKRSNLQKDKEINVLDVPGVIGKGNLQKDKKANVLEVSVAF